MTSVAPGSASRIGNAYYKTEEEYLFAFAEAMSEEYKAIVDAGLTVQIDDALAGAQPHLEFVFVEGFHNVVVGARFETFDGFVLGVLRG